MPIRKADVLAVLADPILARMNFSLGQVFVNVREYGKVAEYIRDGDIGVTPGNGALAYYDGRLNTIETQRGNPPLNLADRAQVLHECTHAIVDINGADVLRQDDEVAGYLAQMLYMHLSNPKPFPVPRPGVAPLGKLVFAINDVIVKYNLLQPEGLGVSISELDIWKLGTDVRRMPEYSHVRANERTRQPEQAGVPVKHNQMRALRAALTQGRRHMRQYTPSPRLDVF